MQTYDSRSAVGLFGVDGWFKARESNANGTGCVEVNLGVPGVVGLRDSKQPDGGVFMFGPAEWRAFLTRVTAVE
ncbi:DUF397 domain-containing protein [Actinophytocola sp.]|uniref:DUF397 domain-containing protein n=1 Tax=Actinophytocola sp. TaxID=1872138 RepID=UPI002ED22FCE